MVERYDVNPGDDPFYDEDGRFVLYDDYRKLLDAVRALSIPSRLNYKDNKECVYCGEVLDLLGRNGHAELCSFKVIMELIGLWEKQYGYREERTES
jgi:hypothetical protein